MCALVTKAWARIKICAQILFAYFHLHRSTEVNLLFTKMLAHCVDPISLLLGGNIQSLEFTLALIDIVHSDR